MFADTGQDWMWGTCTCTAGQGFSSGEKLQYCAKQMKRKFVEISEFWWILMTKLWSLVSDKKAEKFQCIYCSYVGKISQTRWWIETKFCGMTKFHAAWTKFHIIKTKFRFFEVKFCFMERKFHTRLGRELFSWADMTFSIRVRIVYKSWSPSLVSSIKSSVQKTSSLTHRLQAPDRFCKKDENLFRFVPW